MADLFAGLLAGEFARFWDIYPRRVGKLAAEKAYRKARDRATADQILAGVERYIEGKPAYADYCHPSTWLNQGRWLDELPARPKPRSLCPHTPPCERLHQCGQRTVDEYRRAKLKGGAGLGGPF